MKRNLVATQRFYILDRLPRPASLANDPQAFAITIVARSMWPRFRPGRRVAVSPRESVAIGDDVLVTLRAGGGDPAGGSHAVIAELVGRGNESVDLRQFDPDRSFSIDAAAIETMHKIAGELI